MKNSDRYLKIVEWSEEDQCYVGTCPGLFYGGCHGDNEAKVYKELCEIVEENGKPLPPETDRQQRGGLSNAVLRIKPGGISKLVAPYVGVSLPRSLRAPLHRRELQYGSKGFFK
jgi:hypothetical protein